MPPSTQDLARWLDQTQSVGIASLENDVVPKANARFDALDAQPGSLRWLAGPHARVRYPSLRELVLAEARTLAPAPYLSRFERLGQVLDVRLERLTDGRAVAMVFDVTSEARHQVEQQRERDTLLHEERMHAMGVLASGLAHDLNHALNVIALRVATLRADPALTTARRTLEVLSKVVSDAARTVARLQDLARRRRDRPTDPLDLSAVLTGALEMERTEAEAAGVRVEADVPPLPLVRGSAAELAPVFGSLLAHGRAHLPEGGVMRVWAREDRGRVVVTISCPGVTLPDRQLAGLFDPFSGAGADAALGLSIAWGVMGRLGGSLNASNRAGDGTTYTLTFPLAGTSRREPRRPSPEQTGRRVLIVDDEPDNLEVLHEVLELEGQEVVAAPSGPKALELYERGDRFDLVLCDVAMPEMSGWHVAREIQRLAPGTPIYLITGWAREISDTDPRLQLVRGVIPKPIDLDQLRELLSVRAAPSEDARAKPPPPAPDQGSAGHA